MLQAYSWPVFLIVTRMLFFSANLRPAATSAAEETLIAYSGRLPFRQGFELSVKGSQEWFKKYGFMTEAEFSELLSVNM